MIWARVSSLSLSLSLSSASIPIQDRSSGFALAFPQGERRGGPVLVPEGKGALAALGLLRGPGGEHGALLTNRVHSGTVARTGQSGVLLLCPVVLLAMDLCK